MARLFGFSIEDNEKTPPGVVSPIPPTNNDGSEAFASSGFFGSYNLDIEGLYRNETDLIRRYRTMALYPECDSAIEDIVNEAKLELNKIKAKEAKTNSSVKIDAKP